MELKLKTGEPVTILRVDYQDFDKLVNEVYAIKNY